MELEVFFVAILGDFPKWSSTISITIRHAATKRILDDEILGTEALVGCKLDFFSVLKLNEGKQVMSKSISPKNISPKKKMSEQRQ